MWTAVFEDVYRKASCYYHVLLEDQPFLQEVLHRRNEESSLPSADVGVPAESTGRECEGGMVTVFKARGDFSQTRLFVPVCVCLCDALLCSDRQLAHA